MGNHGLFIGNVAAHLVALMSGIASFIIATVEAVRKKQLLANWFWVAGGICIIAACDQAWQDEHRNTQLAENDKAAQVALAESCRQDKRVEDALYAGSQGMVATQRATLDRQQLSNDAQQRDISSCVVSLGKLNPAIKGKRVVAAYNDRSDDTKKLYDWILFVLTNQDEPKAAGTLDCDEEFELSAEPEIVTPSQGFQSSRTNAVRLSKHGFYLNFVSTSSHWSPTTPMFSQIRTKTEKRPICSFEPQ